MSLGYRCFDAARDLAAGSDFAKSIFEAIRLSKAMMVVYSRASEWLIREIEFALARDVLLVPITIGGYHSGTSVADRIAKCAAHYLE